MKVRMKGRNLLAKFFKGYTTLWSTETAKGKCTCEKFDFEDEGIAWIGRCEAGMKFMTDHLVTSHSFS